MNYWVPINQPNIYPHFIHGFGNADLYKYIGVIWGNFLGEGGDNLVKRTCPSINHPSVSPLHPSPTPPKKENIFTYISVQIYLNIVNMTNFLLQFINT